MSFGSKNEDRISTLPKELLSHILSSMPTKFAVRTSVLSKRWRYTWTLTTNLDFDFGDDPLAVHVVERVLNLCKTSKIERFRLCFYPSADAVLATSESKSNVSKCIKKAVRLNVCEVDLNVPPFELPLSLFTCKTLTKLRLGGWGMEGFIGPNVDVITLPLLKTLHITLPLNLPGFVSVNAFKLIHACPILEDLSLETSCIYEQEDYDFNIPTLKRLKLNVRCGYSFINKVILNVPSLEYLCVVGLLSCLFVVQDVSSLVEANVELHDIEADLFILYTALLNGISGAKSILWSSPSLDVLFKLPLPKFPNLKHLELEGSLHAGSLKKLFQHLGSSSELEHFCFQEPKKSCWIDPQSVPTWMLTNLKTMEIRRCKGRECDMQFTEYVLGNSEVLKGLTVTCESLSMEDEKQLCAQLLKCPRATRFCQIHFVGKWLLNVF